MCLFSINGVNSFDTDGSVFQSSIPVTAQRHYGNVEGLTSMGGDDETEMLVREPCGKDRAHTWQIKLVTQYNLFDEGP